MNIPIDERTAKKYGNNFFFLGSGCYGTAYENEEFVIKMTSDEREVEIAKRIKDANCSSLVKIIEVVENAIVQEKVKTDFCTCTLHRIFEEMWCQGISFDCFHLYFEDEILNEEEKWWSSQLAGITFDCSKIGVINPDIHCDNLGLNTNGDLVLFDVSSRKPIF